MPVIAIVGAGTQQKLSRCAINDGKISPVGAPKVLTHAMPFVSHSWTITTHAPQKQDEDHKKNNVVAYHSHASQ
jgi:hypothetical protein